MAAITLEALTEQMQGENSLHGKYLTFSMGDGEIYGIEIAYVTEIIGIQTITPMPETPAYIKGITNLRGKIIAVMDARLRFNRPEKPYDEKTCIIVLDTGRFSIGMIVDRVDEVLAIGDEEIAAPPTFHRRGEAFVTGIGKAQGNIVLLLDCKRLLDTDELVELDGSLEADEA